MEQTLELAIQGYFSQVAKLNGVASALRAFNIAPTVQQTLEKNLQSKSEFLKYINFRGVKNLEGKKLTVGAGSTIAGNTDTSVPGTTRTPRSVHELDDKGYKCRKNNFDTMITYEDLDNWSEFDEFQMMVRDVILEAQAQDRLIIGWNGKSYAATSDRVANPMLEDVNIGWLENIRQDAPLRHFTEVVESSNVINVYEGGDYENIDALVMDAVETYVDERHRENTKLVAIMGRGILHQKYFEIVNQNQPNSEKLSGDMIISKKTVGGLPAWRVPFFPANTILITTSDNLSIYYQNGGRRRHLKDVPEADRIENYESSNDAYVVQDYSKCCLIENINTTAPALPVV